MIIISNNIICPNTTTPFAGVVRMYYHVFIYIYIYVHIVYHIHTSRRLIFFARRYGDAIVKGQCLGGHQPHRGNEKRRPNGYLFSVSLKTKMSSELLKYYLSLTPLDTEIRSLARITCVCVCVRLWARA